MSAAENAPASLNVKLTDLLRASAVGSHLAEQEEPVDAIPTHLETWNRHCRDEGGGKGLAPGWHITIAGNTGTGKSLTALNLGASAVKAGETVGFISLEMSKTQLATRLYAIITETPVRSLERGDDFSPKAAERVANEAPRIREETGGGFYTNAEPIFEIERILGLMRYVAEAKGARIFIVDYLQLVHAQDADSLFRQVWNVSARIREFARQMKVVTVGLSQLNRQTSSNYGDKPTVQGLMASSSLENDSDQVLLLDHSRYERSGDTARTWAILGKNRHGGQGEIPVEWDYRTLKLTEALPHEENDWPGAGEASW